MSERAAMKRRVRGLLHRKWLAPLGAVVLAYLPMLVTAGLVVFLMKPFVSGGESLGGQLSGLFDSAKDLTATLLTLMSGFHFDLTPLLSALPGAAVFLGALVFVGMPVLVSLSGYFLGFLRGKKPPVTEVFSCFSGKYPRILGGMAYMSLWVVLWALCAFVAPIFLYLGGLRLIELFAAELSMYQIPVLGGLIVVCVVWLVVFTLLFINRLLAYSLTPICLAAQPRLPAHRAVRLSRKLMRGCKWQLIGLFLSFATYYIPALIAGVLLLVMPYVAPLFSLSDIMAQSIRLFMWIVVLCNQLVAVFVAPYMAACFRAYYIERKREALMDEEVTPDDFASAPKRT